MQTSYPLKDQRYPDKASNSPVKGQRSPVNASNSPVKGPKYPDRDDKYA